MEGKQAYHMKLDPREPLNPDIAFENVTAFLSRRDIPWEADTDTHTVYLSKPLDLSTERELYNQKFVRLELADESHTTLYRITGVGLRGEDATVEAGRIISRNKRSPGRLGIYPSKQLIEYESIEPDTMAELERRGLTATPVDNDGS